MAGKGIEYSIVTAREPVSTNVSRCSGKYSKNFRRVIDGRNTVAEIWQVDCSTCPLKAAVEIAIPISRNSSIVEVRKEICPREFKN